MKWSLPISLIAVAFLTALFMPAPAARADAAIGQPAPEFKLQGTDGATHQLSDYRGKIVVVYFHSIHCPWAIAYQPIFGDLSKEFGSSADAKQPQVVFLGINSNRGETMDQIKDAASHANPPYLVLKDPHNVVADAYGAVCTPDVYVIDQQGVIRYSGGLEKAPLSPDDVGSSSQQYLKPVLQALIAGKAAPFTTTTPVGCSIRRDRKAS